MIPVVRLVVAGVTLLEMANVQLLREAMVIGEAAAVTVVLCMAAGLFLWSAVAAMRDTSRSVTVNVDYWKQQSSRQDDDKTDRYEMQMCHLY